VLARANLHAPFCTLAGENIGARFVVPTVPRVRELVTVPGRAEADRIETEACVQVRELT
jgi:hypothetical protein